MAEKIDYTPSDRHRKFAAEFVDYVRLKNGDEIISADSFAKMLAIVVKHDADLFFEVTEGINDFKNNKKHKKRTLEDVEKADDDEAEGAAVKKPKKEGQGRPEAKDAAKIAQTWLDGAEEGQKLVDEWPRWTPVIERMLADYATDPKNKKGIAQDAWILTRGIENDKYKPDDDIVAKYARAAPYMQVDAPVVAKKAGKKAGK